MIKNFENNKNLMNYLITFIIRNVHPNWMKRIPSAGKRQERDEPVSKNLDCNIYKR